LKNFAKKTNAPNQMKENKKAHFSVSISRPPSGFATMLKTTAEMMAKIVPIEPYNNGKIKTAINPPKIPVSLPEPDPIIRDKTKTIRPTTKPKAAYSTPAIFPAERAPIFIIFITTTCPSLDEKT
jgi:hypothetical protein